MQLLFSARETIATLVKYKCKTFIALTPALITAKIILLKLVNFPIFSQPLHSKLSTSILIINRNGIYGLEGLGQVKIGN